MTELTKQETSKMSDEELAKAIRSAKASLKSTCEENIKLHDSYSYMASKALKVKILAAVSLVLLTAVAILGTLS